MRDIKALKLPKGPNSQFLHSSILQSIKNCFRKIKVKKKHISCQQRAIPMRNLIEKLHFEIYFSLRSVSLLSLFWIWKSLFGIQLLQHDCTNLDIVLCLCTLFYKDSFMIVDFNFLKRGLTLQQNHWRSPDFQMLSRFHSP